MESELNKSAKAKILGVSRNVFYYKRKKEEKDWKLKIQIEELLSQKPYHSYGSPRISTHLKINHKRVERVMKKFGIKARRRRGKKWKKQPKIKEKYPNLLLNHYPNKPNHIWVADFTHVYYKKRDICVATVMDLYVRKIVGLQIATNHQVQLILGAFFSGINNNLRPEIFHSDNGSEYDSEIFTSTLKNLNVNISRSRPGCPWENGYQESFYNQFKVDLGDPNRFKNLGELVFEIYQTIYNYNNLRIHTSLKMPPQKYLEFCEKKFFALH